MPANVRFISVGVGACTQCTDWASPAETQATFPHSVHYALAEVAAVFCCSRLWGLLSMGERLQSDSLTTVRRPLH